MAEDCTGVLPGGNCTLDENTTAGLIIDSGVTLTVGASVDINHTIDGSDTAFGTIVTGAGTIINQNANIGTNNTIDSISVGANSTLNVNANLFTDQSGGDVNVGTVVGDIDLGTAGTGSVLSLQEGANVRAQVDGVGTGQVISNGDAALTGSINDASIDVQSGELSVTGPLGNTAEITQLDVQSGARLSVDAGSVTTQFLDLDGDLSLSANSALTVTNYTADANNGRMELGINRSGGSTVLPTLTYVAGGPADLGNAEFEFVIEEGTEIIGTESLTNVIIGNTGPATAPSIRDTSFLYDYGFVANGNNLDLDITRADVVASTTTGNNATLAREIFLTLPANTDFAAGAALLSMQKALADASTQSEYNEILESALPTIDASPVAASNFVTSRTREIAGQRILTLRQPARQSSLAQIQPAAGPGARQAYDANSKLTEGGRLWSSTFASTAEQNERDGIDGYDLNSYGIVVGADTGDLNKKWVMGIAGTYGVSDVEAANANRTETEVQSYQVTGYGTYNTANDYFINGAVSIGINDIKARRFNVGTTGRSAFANYDSEHLGLYGEIGADYKKGKMIVTPSFSADYGFYETETYSETGADDLNLTVNEDSLQSLRFSPKLTAQWLNEMESGLRFIPEISAAYSFDVMSDDVSAVAALEGDETSELRLNGFESQDHRINIGLGAAIVGEKWDVKALYDYDWNGDLSAHAAGFQGIYKF